MTLDEAVEKARQLIEDAGKVAAAFSEPPAEDEGSPESAVDLESAIPVSEEAQ